MDKRYQVFVSSTYEDLLEERQEVMQALLELDCIPAGMELFPAADDDQWTLIKKVIDDCDYYIVIIGGRYGSIGPTGISYTEMEYKYAVESGKPIIGFLHKNPEDISAKKSENGENGKEKLNQFRELAGKKMCQFWTSPADLGSKVSRSLIKQIKASPGIGWVRGDLLPSEDTTSEILKLKKKIELLEEEIETYQNKAPKGTENLAQGDDEVSIQFGFRAYSGYKIVGNYTAYTQTTWNEIFFTISPLMIDEAQTAQLKLQLDEFVQLKEWRKRSKDESLKGYKLQNFQLMNEDFQTIIVQLRALGLISKSNKNRSVKDTATYWSLTPYGDNIMTKLRAIKQNIER